MKKQRIRIDDLDRNTRDSLTVADMTRICGGARRTTGWNVQLLPYIEQDNIYKANGVVDAADYIIWR